MSTSSHCSKSSFFVQKINFDFPRKIVELFWVKTRENDAVLDVLAVDNFDFTRKIVKKKFGWKTRENVRDLHFLSCWQLWFPEKIVKFGQNWIFGQKFDFSNSVVIFLKRKLNDDSCNDDDIWRCSEIRIHNPKSSRIKT